MIYLLYNYEEHGPEDVVASTSREAIYQLAVAEVGETKFLMDWYSGPDTVGKKVNLHDGWGAWTILVLNDDEMTKG